MIDLDFMKPEWILSPIAQYGIIGTGLMACLYLWITAKLEIRTVRKALAKIRESADAGMQTLSDGLEEVRNVVKGAPEPSASANALSLNLTKRAQALRMHRRGETIASIAAALQAPLNEIELLLKIDRILDSRPD
jgi:hypothetical protein